MHLLYALVGDIIHLRNLSSSLADGMATLACTNTVDRIQDSSSVHSCAVVVAGLHTSVVWNRLVSTLTEESLPGYSPDKFLVVNDESLLPNNQFRND